MFKVVIVKKKKIVEYSLLKGTLYISLNNIQQFPQTFKKWIDAEKLLCDN